MPDVGKQHRHDLSCWTSTNCRRAIILWQLLVVGGAAERASEAKAWFLNPHKTSVEDLHCHPNAATAFSEPCMQQKLGWSTGYALAIKAESISLEILLSFYLTECTWCCKTWSLWNVNLNCPLVDSTAHIYSSTTHSWEEGWVSLYRMGKRNGVWEWEDTALGSRRKLQVRIIQHISKIMQTLWPQSIPQSRCTSCLRMQLKLYLL